MILSDDEFEGLQTLQQRMLDEALERGAAAELGETELGAIAARLALVAQVDALIGASYGTPEAAEADESDEGDEDDGDDLSADADEDLPIRAARQLSQD